MCRVIKGYRGAVLKCIDVGSNLGVLRELFPFCVGIIDAAGLAALPAIGNGADAVVLVVVLVIIIVVRGEAAHDFRDTVTVEVSGVPIDAYDSDGEEDDGGDEQSDKEDKFRTAEPVAPLHVAFNFLNQ